MPQKGFRTLDIEQILPLLASCYEAGHLVPFIGAGMSRKTFADWRGFVANLEKDPSVERICDPRLEIRAQRAATAIRNSHTDEEFWDIIGTALHGEDYAKSRMPPQTEALARIFWPLSISTNYDPLFYSACRGAFDDRMPPMVLGRSAEDCKQLLASLSSPFDREIIWHIQGFLAEKFPGCPELDHARQVQLKSELVIGHAEYRRAANTAIHFRRCFSEVFRSRSFLFLGSHITEEYLMNLFGETLELCGPSPVPHFAFVKKGEIEPRFLAEEMNITVCEYDEYEDLTEWLGLLNELVTNNSSKVSRWYVQLEDGSSLNIGPFGQLPVPAENSDCAVAIVVRPCAKGLFEPDHDLAGYCELKSKFKNKVFPPGERVLSIEPGLFVVRARTGPADDREVDSVGDAIRDLLGRVAGYWGVLHIHLPAAGGTVPPIYGFIEAVRALGGWARERKKTHAKGQLQVFAHVGPRVSLNLTSRRISLSELLTSRLIRFSTAVNAENGGEAVRRVLYKDPKTPLAEVLKEVLDVDAALPRALHYWSMSVCPSPRHSMPDAATPLCGAHLEKTLCGAGVVFGSVLTLTRSHRQPASERGHAVAAAA